MSVSVKALYTVAFSTLCLAIIVSSYPFITLYTVAKITTKVVVFIPPPVDDGEAPININIIVRIFVTFLSIEIGTVKKPAVLATAD